MSENNYTDGKKVRFLNTAEAAEFLRVKINTLYAWAHQRKIPFRKHGHLLVFSEDELIKWSESKKCETVESLENVCFYGEPNSSLKIKKAPVGHPNSKEEKDGRSKS